MADDADRPLDQVEDGFRFLVHRMFQNTLTEGNLAASLRALVETLVEQGAVDPERLERKRKLLVAAEADRIQTERLILLESSDPDKYRVKSPDVDCASIIPICKTRCCKFSVTLSAQDLDERTISWDYGKPYQIRKKADGYCTHCETATGRCGVYLERPRICRDYDCRKDPRVWVDFEKRILAQDSDDNTRTV